MLKLEVKHLHQLGTGYLYGEGLCQHLIAGGRHENCWGSGVASQNPNSVSSRSLPEPCYCRPEVTGRSHRPGSAEELHGSSREERRVGSREIERREGEERERGRES